MRFLQWTVYGTERIQRSSNESSKVYAFTKGTIPDISDSHAWWMESEPLFEWTVSKPTGAQKALVSDVQSHSQPTDSETAAFGLSFETVAFYLFSLGKTVPLGKALVMPNVTN